MDIVCRHAVDARDAGRREVRDDDRDVDALPMADDGRLCQCGGRMCDFTDAGGRKVDIGTEFDILDIVDWNLLDRSGDILPRVKI